MQLVEVVKLESTPQAVVDTAFRFVDSLGKAAVLCRDTPGFIVNRLLVPYMAQAMKLVDDGVASFRHVDLAMKMGAGHPMGPFTLADYGARTLACVTHEYVRPASHPRSLPPFPPQWALTRR